MAGVPSIRIEGGLLGPDIRDQALSGELAGQRPADFGLEPRRNLTDEIAAVFSDARALWGVFQNRLARLREGDPATTVTRDAWVIPFLGLLGYSPVPNVAPPELDGQLFPVSHRAGEHADSPPIHIVGARQELGRVAASGKPRLAPHSLLQEYLNRTEHVWGLVTNGLTLRLLRDCSFVRRQAYVEFDLPAILDEQRFQDFAALYRLLHRSRLPHQPTDSECLIERYYTLSVEQGGRVRKHLRVGVEECIRLLANGFLSHPSNAALQQSLTSTEDKNNGITAEGLYRQLLKLVYRFLFLLVSEDRGLLSNNSLYHQHYGIARLRRLLENQAACTEDDDIWQSLRVLWQVLIKDHPQPGLNNQPMAAVLGLPVLNGELFAPQFLDGCTISNNDLLTAFWHLAWYSDKDAKLSRRVNYGALDVEELGSVYESLLELHPILNGEQSKYRTFDFQDSMKGNDRKETGSYYTPPQLVNELVVSALDPVIAMKLAATPEQPEQALLSIRVCDPACGSGHFLLAAARRIARELARVRSGEDEPAPERVREAVRDVISHCIYGVDRNPLAVDLCRVALWLESHTADKPLTFLDHRIRWGDSLVGVFDLKCLEKGIPDKAFEPLEGDDKAVARSLAKRNREEGAGYGDLYAEQEAISLGEFREQSRAVDAIPDDSPETIREKKKRFEQRQANPAWVRSRELCDLWTAAFFQPLNAKTIGITNATIIDRMANRPVDPRILGQAKELAIEQQFFHWPLEFPEVFSDGGFDCILSNPPWERVKLQEQEFFERHDTRISAAANKAIRTKMIRELKDTRPDLYNEYVNALRAAGAASSLMRGSGRYPLTGRGDINTYAVFAELAVMAINSSGRAGIILPTGIATDDTTKHFFASIVGNGQLVDLIGFENEDFIFPDVHHAFKFCKMTIAGSSAAVSSSRVGFFIRRFSQLHDEQRFFALEKSDFWLLNPNTGNCPIFRTQADAELTKAIYRRVPILWREGSEEVPESNPWRLTFKTMFHMANDSHHFRTADELRADGCRLEGNVFVSPYDRYLPLYEAKMLHQFDHRFSTYEGATEKQMNVGILPQPTEEQKQNPAFVVQPRYWVREEIVESAIPKFPEPLALAVQIEHGESIRRVLLLWVAGCLLQRDNRDAAAEFIYQAKRFDLHKMVARGINLENPEECARDLQEQFPLTEQDSVQILSNLSFAEEIARKLIDRFSPRWLMGWRDVCRATDRRTLIASLCPRTAVGDKFLLAFARTSMQFQLSLLTIWNSFVCDYVVRQKSGGTALKYFTMRQVAVLHPTTFHSPCHFDSSATVLDWVSVRASELCYTAFDLRSADSDRAPWVWDEGRRFEIRCELDAAMFHLYLPAANSGDWCPTDTETQAQLAALRRHFSTPRHAVAFILEQFPITRQNDEKLHGRYRTRDRILEIYDAMMIAQQTNRPYQTSLTPPPGSSV